LCALRRGPILSLSSLPMLPCHSFCTQKVIHLIGRTTVMQTPCRARRDERGENCCTKVLVPPEPFGSTRTRPLFAEEASPLYAPSKNEVAQRWQKKVDEFDAFIFTAAEYNRGPTALMHDAMI
jgi:hypothetical protein